MAEERRMDDNNGGMDFFSRVTVGSSPPPSPSRSLPILSPPSIAVGVALNCGLNHILHTISKFDTLAGVAIKYGVEVADIKRLNGLVIGQQMFALKTLDESWGWALASLMRAFSKPPSNSAGKRGAAKHDTPNLAVIPSLLAKDNVSNQREHVVHLLANEQSRLRIPEELEPILDEAAVQRVFLKSLDNYINWCKYLA